MTANEIQLPDGEAMSENLKDAIKDFIKQAETNWHINFNEAHTETLYGFIEAAFVGGYCAGYNYCLTSIMGQQQAIDGLKQQKRRNDRKGGMMTKYYYSIRYDNNDETELRGCTERLDFDTLAKRPFVTIVFDGNSGGQRPQRFFVNMAHVTSVREITIDDEEGGAK